MAVSTDVAVIMLTKASMSAVKGRAYDIGQFFLPVFKIKKTNHKSLLQTPVSVDFVEVCLLAF